MQGCISGKCESMRYSKKSYLNENNPHQTVLEQNYGHRV